MSKLINRENKDKLGFKNLLSRKHKRGLTRRDFIKSTVAAGTAASWMSSVSTTNPAFAAASGSVDKIYLGICPYCSVGCTHKIGVSGTNWNTGTVVDIWGDEDNPISKGGLCSKGAAAYFYHTSPNRETIPQIRVGDNNWENTTWAALLSTTGVNTAVSGNVPSVVQALSGAVHLNPDGPNSIAFLGSSHMTNEECYLYRKFVTLIGTANIEHQARI